MLRHHGAAFLGSDGAVAIGIGAVEAGESRCGELGLTDRAITITVGALHHATVHSIHSAATATHAVATASAMLTGLCTLLTMPGTLSAMLTGLSATLSVSRSAHFASIFVHGLHFLESQRAIAICIRVVETRARAGFPVGIVEHAIAVHVHARETFCRAGFDIGASHVAAAHAILRHGNAANREATCRQRNHKCLFHLFSPTLVQRLEQRSAG